MQHVFLLLPRARCILSDNYGNLPHYSSNLFLYHTSRTHCAELYKQYLHQYNSYDIAILRNNIIWYEVHTAVVQQYSSTSANYLSTKYTYEYFKSISFNMHSTSTYLTVPPYHTCLLAVVVPIRVWHLLIASLVSCFFSHAHVPTI